MVDDSRSALVQLKEYQLCHRCLARQTSTTPGRKTVQKCFICRGLMDGLDSMVEEVRQALKPYEFRTFLVGATLPTQIHDREDALRARFKIRGRESAKSQLTREIGQRLARRLKKKTDYLKPDVLVNLTADKDNCITTTVKARPIAFEGRYVKKVRGLPQKQERCSMCLGKGCPLCDYSGLAGYDSVEGIITQHLMAATGGQTPKISWIGSEDQSSLVLGRGRPFYVRISDPKSRHIKKIFSKDGVTVRITGVLEDIPDTQTRFTVKTKIVAKCDRTLAASDMSKLRLLAGREVKFENKSKVTTKKIYSVRASRTSDNEASITITADGGLPIKQFIGGEEYMDPNISQLLGAKCQCVTFDILAVDIQ